MPARFAAAVLLLLPFSAAAAPAGDAKPAAPAQKTRAVIKTSKGTIVARLYPNEAPETVANFVGLATGSKPWTDPRTGEKKTGAPYYDGITFHRVIPNFMAQTGDPLGTGTGGPGYQFKDEFSPKLRFSKAGMLGMANIGPNTNGGQFFITLAPTPWLNDRHTIFGEVLQGQEVVKAITEVATDPHARPNTPITIQSVKFKK
jgi:peptidyl-prolyl cis-trans isomerase A (cyclophilin A)